MALSGRISNPRWRLQWLFLCITLQLQLGWAQTAVSTLFVPDTDSIVSFNLPPDSDDINFYVTTPDWYQYTAIGFGASMSDGLMLVMYPSADHKGVTVSPRRATGNTEPIYSPETQLTVHETTINDNFDMIINATCRGCQSFVKTKSAAPMMFAVGPGLDLSSDDLDARIRRHSAYGHFTINLARATGPGNIPLTANNPNLTTPDAVLSSSSSSSSDGAAFSLQRDGHAKSATAHGILYAVVALAVAPFDSLVAGALGARWAWVHGITAVCYVAFVLGAMVPGVVVSREHVATQQFRTGHQVLGLITVVVLTLMFAWGIGLSWIKRSAKKRGQEPPESTRLLGAIHRWVCRGIWVLLLINVGVGLKLSEQRMVLILGYVALAVGVIIFLVPVYFCLWRISKKRKEKEEGLEMPTIYDHHGFN